MNKHKKRFVILGLHLLAVFITCWLEFLLQKKQHVIGGGINRVLLFLFINIHILALVFLLYLIIRQSIKLFVDWRQEKPGSIFHRNLLFAFSIFSVLPATFVFIIAGKLITTSIDDWFEARLNKGLQSGVLLHENQTAPFKEKLKSVGEQCLNDIKKHSDEVTSFLTKKQETKTPDFIEAFKKNYPDFDCYVLTSQGTPLIGSLKDEMSIWREYRRINDRTITSLKKRFLSLLSKIDDQSTFDFYGSAYWVKKISLFTHVPNQDTESYFISVSRYPPQIRYPLIELETSVHDYGQIRLMHSTISSHYLLIFILAALLILFLSLWCAFYLAKGISKPIQELIDATQKIRAGDLNVSVAINQSSDLKTLAIGFNEMTKTIHLAHMQLEEANKEMLMILENIKLAVFVTNKYGRIIMYNTASKKMVETTLNKDRFKNKKVTFFGPHIAPIFLELSRQLKRSGSNQLVKEITFTHESITKTLMIHLTLIRTVPAQEKQGLLVVIEDLTDIVKINKIKTWQEAARQMAHEIKNPLTPIQLASQRLKRKYQHVLQNDPSFSECIDTILNQVTIIRDLVSHFSQFATMPDDVIEPLDVNELIKEVTCLYELSYPDMNFEYSLDNFLPLIRVDKKKFTGVLVNLLDNSVRAFASSLPSTKKTLTIKTSLKTGRNQIELLISDNGPGIPHEVKNTLFLPYVSSSKKNMGLGLAIVHTSISQMGGSIKLLPTVQGATFQILLPL